MTDIPARSKFRDDINGLRAWAVVAVILYHFGVPGFGGGFIGVDVFFVISGFLMTGIVVGGLERGNFSLIGFYNARAKRIVPALACLCAVLLGLGWFLLLPPDYKTLSSHSVYSLSFLSNIEYWQEAGYFDLASHEKWLLHTWSLSVEWQFYLALPVVLWTTWRLKPGRAGQRFVILACLALSLAAAITITRTDVVAAFFLLHTRAWEMLAGGLLALPLAGGGPSPRMRRWIEGSGLLLILLSAGLFDKDSPWPGWRAMVPVAAAMMVLFANRSSVWTGNKIAQWIGDRSYSMYLWHWPVYVALVYAEFRFNPWAIAGGIVVTFVFGHLSYSLVEQRTRGVLGRLRTPAAAGILVAMVAAVALPTVAVWKLQGVAGRFDPAAELAAAEAGNFNPRKLQCQVTSGATSPSCVYGRPNAPGPGNGKPRVIVIGDSHADSIVSALAQAAAERHAETIEWSYSGCAFISGLKKTPAELATKKYDYRCSDFIEWAKSQSAAQSPSTPLVLVNRYASLAFGVHDGRLDGQTPQVYFSTVQPETNAKFLAEFGQAITNSACELARHRTVYMMRPIPEMGVDVPKTLSRRMTFGMKGDITVSMDSYLRRNGWVIAAQDAARDQCGIKILDPLPYLCRNGECYGSKNGRPLYHDDNHLSEFGNKQLIPLFREVI